MRLYEFLDSLENQKTQKIYVNNKLIKDITDKAYTFYDEEIAFWRVEVDSIQTMTTYDEYKSNTDTEITLRLDITTVTSKNND